MRVTTVVVCALGMLLAASSAHADSVVAVSGSQHFDKVLTENDFVVAEFYAPWYPFHSRSPRSSDQVSVAALKCSLSIGAVTVSGSSLSMQRHRSLLKKKASPWSRSIRPKKQTNHLQRSLESKGSQQSKSVSLSEYLVDDLRAKLVKADKLLCLSDLQKQ